MTKTEFINRVLLIMNEAGMTDVQGNSFLGADSAQIDRYIEGSFENAWRMIAVNVPKSWLKTSKFSYNPHIIKPDGTGFIILPEDFYLLAKFKLTGWQKPIYEASIEDEKVSSIQSNSYTRGSIIRPVGVIGKEYIDDYEIGLYDEFMGFYSTPPVLTTSSETSRVLYFNTNVEKFYHTFRGATITPWAQITTIRPIFATVKHSSAVFDISSYDGMTETRYNVIRHPDGTWGSYSTLKTSNDHVQVLNYYSLPKSDTNHYVESALYVPNVTPMTAMEAGDTVDVDQRIIEPLAYVTAGSVFTIFGKDQMSANLIEKGMLMIPGYKSIKGTNVTFKQ